MSDLVITIDKDVPMSAGLRRSVHLKHKDKLLAMQPGDSFFIAGKTRDDIDGLIRFAKRLGVQLSAINTDEDDVYLEPGVRCWRVAEDASEPVTVGEVQKKVRGQVEAEKQAIADGEPARYWKHVKTGVTYQTARATPRSGDADVIEITEDEWKSGHNFTDQIGVLVGDAGECFLLDTTGTVHRKFPGVACKEAVEPVRMVDMATWVAQEIGAGRMQAVNEAMPTRVDADGTTYWCKPGGDHVKVPASRLETINRAGWVSVTREQYAAWQLEQDDEL